jgi:hypothetical protein
VGARALRTDTSDAPRCLNRAGNIVEGVRRRGVKEKIRCCKGTAGALEELRTFSMLSQDPGYGSSEEELMERACCVGRLLHGETQSTEPASRNPYSLIRTPS